MFDKSHILDANRSDQIARQHYMSGDYRSALLQNQTTAEIIGGHNQATLKNTAACYSYLFEPEKAITFFERYMNIATEVVPDDYRTLADYYSQAGKLDESFTILNNSDKSTFQIQHDIVMHLFRNQRYEQAFKLFDKAKREFNILWIGHKRWESLPSCKRWSGEDLAGKSVCLVGECGLGDEIIFSRWIPDLLKIAGQVDYLTDNSLIDVFQRNFEGLGAWDERKSYDYWLPTMNLPLALNSYTPGTDSYITACDSYVNKWKLFLPNNKAIHAFNWTGSRNFAQNLFRDIPIDDLLTKVSNAVNVNVCMETDYNPHNMLDLRRQINSWEDTLAILRLSDMVFSSCSSVAHAAGALGKPTFVYTRPDDYFTWSSAKTGSTSKWYNSVTVWRTNKIGRWDDVINQSLDPK